MAKKEVAVRKVLVPNARVQAVLDAPLHPLPPIIDGVIDVKGWLRAVLLNEEYNEPDPEYLSKLIMLQTLEADTLEEALSNGGMDGIQDIIEDYAGATTGPILITDLYVAKSDMDEGASCYVILTWESEITGETVRCSTGAQSVQTGLLKAMMLGIFPIRCEIKRDKSTDAGGRHLLKVWIAD